MLGNYEDPSERYFLNTALMFGLPWPAKTTPRNASLSSDDARNVDVQAEHFIACLADAWVVMCRRTFLAFSEVATDNNDFRRQVVNGVLNHVIARRGPNHDVPNNLACSYRAVLPMPAGYEYGDFGLRADLHPLTPELCEELLEVFVPDRILHDVWMHAQVTSVSDVQSKRPLI